jgi:hypothetical protein
MMMLDFELDDDEAVIVVVLLLILPHFSHFCLYETRGPSFLTITAP